MSTQKSNVKINLGGKWLYAFAQAGTVSEADVLSSQDKLEWRGCDVPGNAQLDLMKSGLIDDPFVAMNTEAVRKFESCEWWYKTGFTVPQELRGQRLELLFHGLDTLADVWLNGNFLGSTENMFIPHGFMVDGCVSETGPNELVVRFSPPQFAAIGKEYSGCFASMGTYESLWVRKARHSFGWDIAPRLVTAGIWREVELVGHDDYEIRGVFARVAELSGSCATLVFHVDMDLPKGSWDGLKLVLRGECGGDAFVSECGVCSVRTDLAVELQRAKLWWPVDFGNPNLYTISVSLCRNGEEVHRLTERIGIRTITLDQEPDDNGNRNFIFKVNGAPVFCRGTNSVPMDAFHSRDLERIPEFIRMVRDTNCNMVRVWGGGVYEHELFYDLCDEQGIMVMQDFMYACAIYPQLDEFLKTAEKEAIQVVKALRNHPSLVAWSGDNEGDQAYFEWYHQSQSPENNQLTRRVLKTVCQNVDGTRPYMPSSPYSPTVGADPNSELEGDRHFYRHGTYYKSDEYLKDAGRFYSEIGHLSLDNEDSIRKFIPAHKLWPIDRAVWDHHTGSQALPYVHPDRLRRIFDSIENLFGSLPDNLADLVLASQIVQAEALKFWIERCRMRRFDCGGILWWNLIDCWPQFSDAVVDYYYGKKLAYHFVKKAQEPVHVMISEPENQCARVIACNDTNHAVTLNYRISLAGSGERTWEGCSCIEANAKRVIDEIKVPDSEHQLYLIRWTIEDKEFSSHYLAGRPPFTIPEYKQWLAIL